MTSIKRTFGEYRVEFTNVHEDGRWMGHWVVKLVVDRNEAEGIRLGFGDTQSLAIADALHTLYRAAKELEALNGGEHG